MKMVKKVLIVEDEEEILELLSEIFSDLKGYRILYAKDGEEALRILRGDNPDIMILDVQIPKINGYEICEIVKSDLAMSHIKVLMLSGMAQNYDRRKSEEVGADAYISKPFSSIILVDKVEELLRGD